MWVSSWDDQKLIHSLTQYDIKTFNAHCRSNNSLVWNAYAVANEQVCESVSVLYNVSVTFPRGVQTVDYSISDARTLPRRVDIYDTIDISGAYDDPNLNQYQKHLKNGTRKYQKLSLFLMSGLF